MIRARFEEWTKGIPAVDPDVGMTYGQFKEFLKNKMEEGFTEEEQFQAVCGGLDPESTGFIKIDRFIEMVTELEDEMMMADMHADIER